MLGGEDRERERERNVELLVHCSIMCGKCALIAVDEIVDKPVAKLNICHWAFWAGVHQSDSGGGGGGSAGDFAS